MLFGFIFYKLIAYSFFLIWTRRVCNICLNKALFNVCGLPELLVLSSGLFLSELVIFLCLFLNPCFILPGSHLQEEEVEEFGVSDWRQHTHIHSSFIICIFSYLLSLIFCCFGIFFLLLTPFLLTIHFNVGVLFDLRLKHWSCKLFLSGHRCKWSVLSHLRFKLLKEETFGQREITKWQGCNSWK